MPKSCPALIPKSGWGSDQMPGKHLQASTSGERSVASFLFPQTWAPGLQFLPRGARHHREVLSCGLGVRRQRPSRPPHFDYRPHAGALCPPRPWGHPRHSPDIPSAVPTPGCTQRAGLACIFEMMSPPSSPSGPHPGLRPGPSLLVWRARKGSGSAPFDRREIVPGRLHAGEPRALTRLLQGLCQGVRGERPRRVPGALGSPPSPSPLSCSQGGEGVRTGQRRQAGGSSHGAGRLRPGWGCGERRGAAPRPGILGCRRSAAQPPRPCLTSRRRSPDRNALAWLPGPGRARSA